MRRSSCISYILGPTTPARRGALATQFAVENVQKNFPTFLKQYKLCITSFCKKPLTMFITLMAPVPLGISCQISSADLNVGGANVGIDLSSSEITAAHMLLVQQRDANDKRTCGACTVSVFLTPNNSFINENSYGGAFYDSRLQFGHLWSVQKKVTGSRSTSGASSLSERARCRCG